MRRNFARITLIISCLVLAPVWAQTQKPQQPVFRSDAHFVLVDAYPLRDGKVVEGLAAADFEVREEGVLQTIDTFEFVDGGAPVPESARRDPNTVAESKAQVADPRARSAIPPLIHGRRPRPHSPP